MALIIPEIYANIVTQKEKGRMIVSQLATDLGYLSNTQVGGKVTFPKFKLIGDVEDMTNWNGSQELTSEQLDQTFSEAVIKEVGKSVFIRELDDITALGNFVQNAGEQTGAKIARQIDKDLIAECLTSPLKSATAQAKAITINEIDDALTLFGDDQSSDSMSGIVVNSMLTNSFLADEKFVDVNKTFNGLNGNGIVRPNGMLGYYRNIPVFISDANTYDTVKQECVSFIIKKNALGIMVKRDLKTDEVPQVKKGGSDVVATKIYAVKLVADDGVITLRKTIA